MFFLVPVALVALVRENVLDHAIWAVAVVSHPVVADHHRHHSLQLDSVQAPVMEIADVIAHTTHFRLFLSLSSLPPAGGGAGIHPGGSPGGSGGPGNGDGPRGTSGSSEKVNLVGDRAGLIFSFVFGCNQS